MNLPIGLQLYTVRDDVAKDLPGTLQAIAAIGYREVELARMLPQPASEVRSLLRDHGLEAPGMLARMADLQTDLQQLLDYVIALGAQYLVCSFPWTADARFQLGPRQSSAALAAGITLDDWKWNADELNRIGELAGRAGLRFAYHNHNMEFRSYGGVVAYDELLRLTEPRLVTMELDIGWVAAAGVEPLHYLVRHAERISLLHVKDLRKGASTVLDRIFPQTTEVGSGQVDWHRLFAALEGQRIRHYFVEQENFERAPLEAARASFDYLSRLGS